MNLHSVHVVREHPSICIQGVCHVIYIVYVGSNTHRIYRKEDPSLPLADSRKHPSGQSIPVNKWGNTAQKPGVHMTFVQHLADCTIQRNSCNFIMCCNGMLTSHLNSGCCVGFPQLVQEQIPSIPSPMVVSLHNSTRSQGSHRSSHVYCTIKTI